MFGKPDPRDAEILFLREQVKTLRGDGRYTVLKFRKGAKKR